jgi:hypothetical protein
VVVAVIVADENVSDQTVFDPMFRMLMPALPNSRSIVQPSRVAEVSAYDVLIGERFRLATSGTTAKSHAALFLIDATECLQN